MCLATSGCARDEGHTKFNLQENSHQFFKCKTKNFNQ